MDESNFVEAISPIGELTGPYLLKPDTRYDPVGVYKAKLKVRADDPVVVEFLTLLEKVQQEEHGRQVQKAESMKKGSGKKVRLADLPLEKTEENAVAYVVFYFKSRAHYTDRKTGQSVERKIPLFDGEGTSIIHETNIGSGTVGRISTFISPFYTALLGAGVTLRIRAVKILKSSTQDVFLASNFGFGEIENYKNSMDI